MATQHPKPEGIFFQQQRIDEKKDEQKSRRPNHNIAELLQHAAVFLSDSLLYGG